MLFEDFILVSGQMSVFKISGYHVVARNSKFFVSDTKQIRACCSSKQC